MEASTRVYQAAPFTPACRAKHAEPNIALRSQHSGDCQEQRRAAATTATRSRPPRQQAQTTRRKPPVAVRIGGKRVAERHHEIRLAPRLQHPLNLPHRPLRVRQHPIRPRQATFPGIAARSTFSCPGARVPAAPLPLTPADHATVAPAVDFFHRCGFVGDIMRAKRCGSEHNG